MLAIVFSYKAFRSIIGGNILTIFTDNKNLTFDPAIPNSRAQRWKSILLDANYKLIHVAGIENGGADFLSRNFLGATGNFEYTTLLTELMAAQHANFEELSLS